MSDRRLPLLLLGILSLALYGLNFRSREVLALVGVTGQWTEVAGYLAFYLPAFALYSAAIWLAHRRLWRISIPVMIAFAVAFRLSLMMAPPGVLSDDLFRYLWDGRVQAAGLNPYLYPPSAPQLAGLKDDEVYPRINRPELVTIYPGGAQHLFRLLHHAGGTATAARLGFTAFDLAGLWLIASLLKRRGQPASRSLIYAWNPLVIVETAYGAHLEAALVPLVVLALYLQMTGKISASGAALGAATAIKLYPAVLLPALVSGLFARRCRGWHKTLGPFCLVIFAAYLPFLNVGNRVVGFLPDYLGPVERFNLGIPSLIRGGLKGVGIEHYWLSYLLSLVLFAFWVAFTIIRQARGKGDALEAGMGLAGGYFLLAAPSVHPWYIIFMVPFLCFRASPGWIYFTGAVALSYIKYVDPANPLPLWVSVAEYLPLFGLLALELIAPRSGRDAVRGDEGRKLSWAFPSG